MLQLFTHNQGGEERRGEEIKGQLNDRKAGDAKAGKTFFDKKRRKKFSKVQREIRTKRNDGEKKDYLEKKAGL